MLTEFTPQTHFNTEQALPATQHVRAVATLAEVGARTLTGMNREIPVPIEHLGLENLESGNTVRIPNADPYIRRKRGALVCCMKKIKLLNVPLRYFLLSLAFLSTSAVINFRCSHPSLNGCSNLSRNLSIGAIVLAILGGMLLLQATKKLVEMALEPQTVAIPIPTSIKV